ncbi:MAG: hypothetical protein ACRELG_06060, partial [Gemmataceae bacterium]
KGMALPLDGYSIEELAFSPDGTRLLAADDKEIAVWNLQTRKKVGALLREKGDDGTRPRYRDGYLSPPPILALSPDGRIVAHLKEKTRSIHLEEIGKRKTIRKLNSAHDGDPIRRLVFSQDGKTLIAAGEQSIRLWDVTSGKERSPRIKKATFSLALAVSPDDKTLATAEYGEPEIALWDAVKGQRLRLAEVESGRVTKLSYSDRKTLVSITDQGLVRFWDAVSGKCLRRLVPERQFGEIHAVSPGGELLAGVAERGRVGVWDTATDKIRWQTQTPYYRVTRLLFSPDGKTLTGLGSRDNTFVLCWDTTTGKAISPGAIAQDKEFLFQSSDGRKIALASRKEVQVYRVRPDGRWRLLGAPIPLTRKLLPLSETGYSVHDLSPDGRSLLVKSWETLNQKDSHLGFVECASGGFTGWLRSGTEENENQVQDAVFSPDGKTVASTHLDGTIRLWDVLLRTEVGRFFGGGGQAGRIAFSPDGQSVASVEFDRTVLI